LRHPWEEFDLDNAKWAIPAKRMKNAQVMRADDIYIVLLSRQAGEILRALKMLSGTYKVLVLYLERPAKQLGFACSERGAPDTAA
jgi:hypothetical protein